MSKERTHNPDQAALFSGGRNWNDPEPLESLAGVQVGYGEPGTYVSVEERAKFLVAALNSFSQRNIRRRFPLAAYTSQHSADIWARYQEHTEPTVIPGARRNEIIYANEARVNFWRATGFSALRKSVGVENIIRPKQINDRAIKMWDDFQGAYALPKYRKERNRYKRQLKKFIPEEQSEEEQAA